MNNLKYPEVKLILKSLFLAKFNARDPRDSMEVVNSPLYSSVYRSLLQYLEEIEQMNILNEIESLNIPVDELKIVKEYYKIIVSKFEVPIHEVPEVIGNLLYPYAFNERLLDEIING